MFDNLDECVIIIIFPEYVIMGFILKNYNEHHSHNMRNT